MPEEEINTLVSTQKLQYFEGSAKKNINVQESFLYLAQKMRDKFYEENDQKNIQSLMEGKKNNKKCC